MNFAAALLAPFLLLFTTGETSEEIGEGRGRTTAMVITPPLPSYAYRGWPMGGAHSFEPDSASQVHFEQRVIIRVAPRGTTSIASEAFSAPLRRSVAAPQLTERKIGKCLPVSGILGVEPSGTSSLFLHMRDGRLINAQLAETCRSRSFYSGFYLSRSADGRVCVDRDVLHSRSGTACKLSRIRQLVEQGD